MADEPKKPDAKPADKPSNPDGVTPIIIAIIALLFLGSLWRTISTSSLFTNGWKGLTPSGIVLRHTRPLASLINPIGVRVVALNNLNVWSDSGGFLSGARKLGEQKFKARGIVNQGPVVINRIGYYYVDFDSGVDGWVSEKDLGFVESEPNAFERIILFFTSVVFVVKIISYVFSFALLIFIIYVAKQLQKLRKAEHDLLYPQMTNFVGSGENTRQVNPRWERVEAHAESPNENDWRLAILEADIMLDDLLDTLSLPGDTMADKLKAVEKSDFTTIDLAWEAHKIRNQIAHEGAGFLLNQREAKRVIGLYRQIFEEFKIV